jgi:hypothetical protein
VLQAGLGIVGRRFVDRLKKMKKVKIWKQVNSGNNKGCKRKKANSLKKMNGNKNKFLRSALLF